MTAPSIRRSVPVMKVPSRPIRNAAAAPISSGLPTRPAAEALIIRWYASPAGELSSSKASGVMMMPGLIELRRAPRSPHWTLAAWTRTMLARLASAYAAPELVTTSGCRNGRAGNSSAGVVASAWCCSGGGGGADGFVGGDVDCRRARGESGSLQRLRRCRCRFLVEVGQHDRLADPDAAGDRLTDGPGADDDDNQLGCCGHGDCGPSGRSRPDRALIESSNRFERFLILPGSAPAWETVLFGGATGPPTANQRSRRLLPSWTPWPIPRQPVAAPNWGVSCGHVEPRSALPMWAFRSSRASA